MEKYYRYICILHSVHTQIHQSINPSEMYRSLALCEHAEQPSQNVCIILRLFLPLILLSSFGILVLIVFGMLCILSVWTNHRPNDGGDGSAFIWNMLAVVLRLLLFSTQCYYIIDSLQIHGPAFGFVLGREIEYTTSTHTHSRYKQKTMTRTTA